MIADLLKKTSVVVSPETYAVISVSHDAWLKLLEDPKHSPRMTTPFVIFKDKWEVTLVLDEVDFDNIKSAIQGAQIERNFRLLTFDVELEFDVVGFMAKIAGIFAEAGISILPISSFSRDHVLIGQLDLARGLKALGKYVDEIC